jgi:hypothetical protein
MIALRVLFSAAVFVAINATTAVYAQSSKFRCQRIDAVDDNPKSKHKWQTFAGDVSSQKRVFYIDAPCSDAGPAHYATGGGFEFGVPFLHPEEITPWSVVGSFSVDQTSEQPARSWRCVAAWNGQSVPIGPPTRLWCHAMCCRWTGNDR